MVRSRADGARLRGVATATATAAARCGGQSKVTATTAASGPRQSLIDTDWKEGTNSGQGSWIILARGGAERRPNSKLLTNSPANYLSHRAAHAQIRRDARLR